MKSMSGIVLIIGSILALIAVFMPISTKVFGNADDSTLQAEYIQEDEIGWAISSFFLGFGGIVAAAGLGLFAKHLYDGKADSTTKLTAYLSVGGAVVGAVLWAIICYKRITLPIPELVENFNVYDWMFIVYTVITTLAQVVLGFVLTRIGFKRVGWATLVFGGLSLLLYIIVGDHYPLLHYVIFLPMGIALVRQKSAVLQAE